MAVITSSTIDAGGADEVTSLAIKQHQRRFLRVWANDGTPSRNPVDVSSWTMEAYAEYRVCNSDNGTQVDWLQPIGPFFPNFAATTVTLTTATGGPLGKNLLQTEIPKNVFMEEIPINAAFVPCLLVYVEADPGPNFNTHLFRFTVKIYSTPVELGQ